MKTFRYALLSLFLPLMLAAILASFLADLFHHESVYTMPLRRRGIAPLRSGEVDLMDTVAVGDVMVTPAVVARLTTVADELRAQFAPHRTHGAPVLDDEDTLVGIVTSTDLIGDGSAHFPELQPRNPWTFTRANNAGSSCSRWWPC